MAGIFARIAINKRTGIRMSTNISGKIGLMFTVPLEKLFSFFKKKPKDTREDYDYKCKADDTHACDCPGDGPCHK